MHNIMHTYMYMYIHVYTMYMHVQVPHLVMLVREGVAFLLWTATTTHIHGQIQLQKRRVTETMKKFHFNYMCI